MQMVSHSIHLSNGKVHSAREAAERYLSRGCVPIPVRPGTKQPIPPAWETITIENYDLATLFPRGANRNIGILLGVSSRGLVDCDLDCNEARRAAAILMPPTEMIWGRRSAPDSHRGYVVIDPPNKATEPYNDPLRKGKNTRLLELRSTGAQTIVPPSILPGDDTGKVEEACIWQVEGQPAHIDLACLRRAVRRVAAAALLGRSWLRGNRHQGALALAGGLLRAQWATKEVIAFVRAVCAAAEDDEIDDRERAVEDTAERIQSGQTTTAWPALIVMLGEHGEALVKAVCTWLEIPTRWYEARQPGLNGSPTQQPDGDEAIDGVTLRLSPAAGKPGRFVAVAFAEDSELHRDVIDPNSAISRDRFVDRIMRERAEGDTDGSPSDLREKLDRHLRSRADATRAAAGPTAPPSGEQIPEDPRLAELEKMPADVRADAEEMLRDPKLLERVSEDIRALGVAGENRNRVILYLTGMSAQLLRPLAVITRGASSTGKSFLDERVSRLFPPEVVLRATSLTPNALFYFRPGTLRHRWVIAGERSRLADDDAAEATRALREMIESGRLSKAVPVKDAEGMVTRLIEQDGPIAYTESTTAGSIDEEDANRCLLLATDESEDQTKRILQATAIAATGQDEVNVDRVIALHWAIQRMIPRADVVVPFAESIAENYPTERHESRRDFRHLIQLVKAIALLHFRQRRRDSSGRIIATLEDYAKAEHLAREPLGSSASGLTPGARHLFEQLRELFEGSEFTTSQVKRFRGASPRTLENRLLELDRAGAVEQIQHHRGRIPAKWKLTGRDPASGEGILPTVEQVRESFGRCERADNAEVPEE